MASSLETVTLIWDFSGYAADDQRSNELSRRNIITLEASPAPSRPQSPLELQEALASCSLLNQDTNAFEINSSSSQDSSSTKTQIFFKPTKKSPDVDKLEVASSVIWNLILPPHWAPEARLAYCDGEIVGVGSEFKSDFHTFDPGLLELKSFGLDKISLSDLDLKKPKQKQHKSKIIYLPPLYQFAPIEAASAFMKYSDQHRANSGIRYKRREGTTNIYDFHFAALDFDMSFYDSLYTDLRPYDHGRSRNALQKISARQIKTLGTVDIGQTYSTAYDYSAGPFHNGHDFTSEDRRAIRKVTLTKEYNQLKYRTLLKILLLKASSIRQHLNFYFEDNDPIIDIVTNAFAANQAQYKSVLMSMPEFSEYLANESYLTKKLGDHTLIEELTLQVHENDRTYFHSKINKLKAYFSNTHNEKDDTCYTDGDTPLHTAIKTNKFRANETLFQFNEFKFERNNSGLTPFMLACKLGRLTVIKELVKTGICNPLFIHYYFRLALAGNHTETADYLAKRFKLNLREHVDKKTIATAISKQQYDTVSLLWPFANNTTKAKITFDFAQAITSAVKNNQYKAIEFLAQQIPQEEPIQINFENNAAVQAEEICSAEKFATRLMLLHHQNKIHLAEQPARRMLQATILTTGLDKYLASQQINQPVIQHLQTILAQENEAKLTHILADSLTNSLRGASFNVLATINNKMNDTPELILVNATRQALKKIKTDTQLTFIQKKHAVIACMRNVLPHIKTKDSFYQLYDMIKWENKAHKHIRRLRHNWRFLRWLRTAEGFTRTFVTLLQEFKQKEKDLTSASEASKIQSAGIWKYLAGTYKDIKPVNTKINVPAA